jgi:hypothetical protein
MQRLAIWEDDCVLDNHWNIIADCSVQLYTENNHYRTCELGWKENVLLTNEHSHDNSICFIVYQHLFDSSCSPF